MEARCEKQSFRVTVLPSFSASVFHRQQNMFPFFLRAFFLFASVCNCNWNGKLLKCPCCIYSKITFYTKTKRIYTCHTHQKPWRDFTFISAWGIDGHMNGICRAVESHHFRWLLRSSLWLNCGFVFAYIYFHSGILIPTFGSKVCAYERVCPLQCIHIHLCTLPIC